MRRVLTPLGAAAAVLIALTACGDPPSEGPVPDATLFDQVADLPGVVSADVELVQVFGSPPGYAGTIKVDPAADPLCVLDEALSVLHQGRRGVDLSVMVQQGRMLYDHQSLLGDQTPDERYGAAPAAPQPTATVRPCTPPSPTVQGSAASPSVSTG